MAGDLLAPPVPYAGVVNQWTQGHLRGLNEPNNLVFLLMYTSICESENCTADSSTTAVVVELHILHLHRRKRQ